MDSTPAATGPTIFSVTLTLAATEYSQLLQDGSSPANPSLKKIQVRCQNNTNTLQYAYVSGGPYFDLLAGEVYWQDGLHAFNKTIYLKSPNAGCIVDIEVWY